MASTYSNLKIELIGTGEQAGTWGTTTNTNLGTAIDEAISGRANAVFATDADLTITLTNTNASQVARNYILNVTSSVSLTATRNLIVPTINKPYIVENNTTGGQSIVVKTVAGTGITVPNGKTVMVYANGTNVVQAENYIPSLTLGSALPVGSGGTGQTSYTDGQLLIGNSVGNTLTKSTLTAGTGISITNGNGSISIAATGGGMVYPGAGIPNSTGSAWGTSYTTSGSGTVVALNNSPTLTNPTVTNYTETLFSANSGTAITLALTNGTFQYITLTGNATITMPTAAAGKSFILLLAQDATGSRTVTWSTVVWPGGTAPTITSTASKKDLFSFFSDGTNWYGATISQNY